MGQVVSVVSRAVGKSNDEAQNEKDKAKTELDTLMTDLQNKLATFEAKVVASRGVAESETEIDGGRSVMRVSELRVATEAGIAEQIQNAIGSFIQLAQGGEKPKQAAVEGAEALLTSGIDALFGVSGGASMEKTGFIVMFMNYAFVRVDYFIYSYNISGSKFGAEKNTAGCCYLADLAVLKLEDLKASEIDFLISQSLKITNTMQRVGNLTALKIQLAESAVLSRLLRDSNAENLDAILAATTDYMQTQNEIAKIMKDLPDFIPNKVD